MAQGKRPAPHDNVHNEDRRGSKQIRDLLPESLRNIIIMFLGEFCGTYLFLLLAFIGAQIALDAQPSDSAGNDAAVLSLVRLLFISLSFGTSLTVSVWIFFRVSGGMLNPAVTLGLLLVGAISPLHALVLVPSQLVAAIAAAAAVDGLLPGPLTVACQLNGGTNIAQGLFLEMFLTSQLVLTVYFLAIEKHKATYLAPIGIGLSLFMAHIAGVRWTGAGINPARAFGPSVIAGFPGYHWIYWLGPCLGSFLAYMVWTIFKALDYESAKSAQGVDTSEQQMANNVDEIV